MEQMIINHCIEGKPTYSLKECLTKYDNARLVELSDKQHLLLNMGREINLETLRTKEVIASLYTRIHSHFEQDLFYLPPREIAFVRKFMNLGLQAGEPIDYEDCKFLHSLGYIHFFNYKGRLYPVMPKEMRAIYKSIPEKEIEEEVRLNNGFYAYAIALTQIHGIYTIEHFVEVWNTYHDEKTDFDEMLTYFDMMYDRQDYFSFDYMYVVTNYPSNNDGYKLLEGDFDKSYRMPSKEEIELYTQGTLGKESPYYEKLAKLI